MRKIILLTIAFFIFFTGVGLAEQCGGKDDAYAQSVLKMHQIAPFHTVIDWRLSTGVKSDRCPQKDINTAVVKGTKLFVWMRSAGNKAALDYIIKNNLLPLKHAWQHKIGNRWKVKETIRVSGRSISDNDISGLRIELQNREFFDWRTWSCKQNLEPGRWKVSIVDRLGAPVKCIGGINELQPCLIEFEIKE